MAAGAPKGNSNAAKGKDFKDALRKALANGGESKLPSIAEKLVDLAVSGEQWAIQEVANRLDGRPAQEVAVTGEGGGPLRSELAVSWVIQPVKPVKDA
jgi:hypothetical protein